MPSDLDFENLPPFLGFDLVPDFPQPLVHLLTLGNKLLSARSASYFELSMSRQVTKMGEPQVIERVRTAVLSLGISSFIPPKAEVSAFCRVYLQSISAKSALKRLFYPLRILHRLHYAHKIVSVADNLTETSHMASHH